MRPARHYPPWAWKYCLSLYRPRNPEVCSDISVKHHYDVETWDILKWWTVVKHVHRRFVDGRCFEEPLPRPQIERHYRQCSLERVGECPSGSIPLPWTEHRQGKLRYSSVVILRLMPRRLANEPLPLLLRFLCRTSPVPASKWKGPSRQRKSPAQSSAQRACPQPSPLA